MSLVENIEFRSVAKSSKVSIHVYWNSLPFGQEITLKEAVALELALHKAIDNARGGPAEVSVFKPVVLT